MNVNDQVETDLNEKKIFLSKITFFFGLFTVILRGIYVNSSLSVVYSGSYSQYLSYLSFFLFIISIFAKSDFSKRWVLVSLISLTIGTFIFYYSGDNNILLIVLFALSSWEIDLQKIIKFIFTTSLILFVSIIILNKLGILPNIITYKNGLARNSFGFLYTSGLSAFASFIYLNYLLIKREKYRLRDMLLGVILSSILFYFTRVSQDSLLVVFEAIIVYLINIEKKDIFGKISRLFSVIVAPLSLVFIFATSYMFTPYSTFWVNFDSHLSGRLYLGRELISNYTIKLFGQPIPQIGSAGLANIRNSGDYWTQYFYIDSSYLRFIYMYGICSIVLVAIFYFILIRKIIRYNDSYLAVCIIVVSVLGITGQYMSGYSPNFLWALIFSQYTYSSLKEKKKCLK
ncbi:hypothetical protein P7H76_02525 [Lactococcus lactis]|uniref:hypothetical protein n=1 Tax=Lactococcus lactis TaxID=1358 RepID=UPI002890B315|nr:hypothetical protein [Lactococcus lactis]MDT2886056.1 hypothetical protein [Lactococcus lactis]